MPRIAKRNVWVIVGGNGDILALFHERTAVRAENKAKQAAALENETLPNPTVKWMSLDTYLERTRYEAFKRGYKHASRVAKHDFRAAFA